MLPVTVAAQTVTEFIQMIDTQYLPYGEGEFWANDSLVDISNGYYERVIYFSEDRSDDPRILRQVAVFNNKDRTKTIVETDAYWDFACWMNRIKFYDYNGDTLRRVEQKAHFLPDLTEADLLTKQELAIFKKYHLQVNPDHYPTLENFISEAYDLRFVLPRYGTDIQVELEFCDYFGTDFPNLITEEEYEKIENGGVPMKLAYNRKQKRFNHGL